jgi:hypothetical protein
MMQWHNYNSPWRYGPPSNVSTTPTPILIYRKYRYITTGWDSAVGSELEYADNSRVRAPIGIRFFWCPHRVARFWGTPSLGLFIGERWPGREADYSPPTSAEVKNTGIYTATPRTSS